MGVRRYRAGRADVQRRLYQSRHIEGRGRRVMYCGWRRVMEPGHWALAGLIVVAIGVPVAGFIYIHRMVREAARISRAVAALVYQEEEKTRARLAELLARPPR
jgi:hypothetical protein